MSKKPWKLAEITQRDILDMEKPFEVAVLPIASTEPHNYHLPYGSDTIQAESVSDRICERAWAAGARVVLLPTIPYGVNWNLIKFPLTIHMSVSTHKAIIEDIVKSLTAHGIRKIMIVNGHGGNEIRGILRDLYASHDAFICLTSWWCAAHETYQSLFVPGGHADDQETSTMLALAPHLVQLGQADEGRHRKTRFAALEDGSVWFTRPWHLLTESSGMGDPTSATAEKGEAYLETVVAKLADFVKELSDAEMDEKFPY